MTTKHQLIGSALVSIGLYLVIWIITGLIVPARLQLLMGTVTFGITMITVLVITWIWRMFFNTIAKLEKQQGLSYLDSLLMMQCFFG